MALAAVSHSCPKSSDKGDLSSSLSLSTSSSWHIHLFIQYAAFCLQALSSQATERQLPQLTPELIILERCYISFAHLHVLENCLYWACKIIYTQAWRKLVLQRPTSVIKRLPVWPQFELNVSSKPITYSVYTQWV